MIRWCIKVGNEFIDIYGIFLYILKLKQVSKIGFRVTNLNGNFFIAISSLKKNELDEASSTLSKK
jgi:hypothetical protein